MGEQDKMAEVVLGLVQLAAKMMRSASLMLRVLGLDYHAARILNDSKKYERLEETLAHELERREAEDQGGTGEQGLQDGDDARAEAVVRGGSRPGPLDGADDRGEGEEALCRSCKLDFHLYPEDCPFFGAERRPPGPDGFCEAYEELQPSEGGEGASSDPGGEPERDHGIAGPRDLVEVPGEDGERPVQGSKEAGPGASVPRHVDDCECDHCAALRGQAITEKYEELVEEKREEHFEEKDGVLYQKGAYTGVYGGFGTKAIEVEESWKETLKKAASDGIWAYVLEENGPVATRLRQEGKIYLFLQYSPRINLMAKTKLFDEERPASDYWNGAAKVQAEWRGLNYYEGQRGYISVGEGGSQMTFWCSHFSKVIEVLEKMPNPLSKRGLKELGFTG